MFQKVYWDEMFNSQSEATTITDMNAGTTATAGNYAVRVAGVLLKVVIMWAGEAATSLVEAIRVELECSIWTPNRSRFGLTGAGLRTAPAFPVPDREYEVRQPVSPNNAITGQIIHPTAATPITNNTRVYGQFSAA